MKKETNWKLPKVLNDGGVLTQVERLPAHTQTRCDRVAFDYGREFPIISTLNVRGCRREAVPSALLHELTRGIPEMAEKGQGGADRTHISSILMYKVGRIEEYVLALSQELCKAL